MFCVCLLRLQLHLCVSKTPVMRLPTTHTLITHSQMCQQQQNWLVFLSRFALIPSKLGCLRWFTERRQCSSARVESPRL